MTLRNLTRDHLHRIKDRVDGTTRARIEEAVQVGLQDGVLKEVTEINQERQGDHLPDLSGTGRHTGRGQTGQSGQDGAAGLQVAVITQSAKSGGPKYRRGVSAGLQVVEIMEPAKPAEPAPYGGILPRRYGGSHPQIRGVATTPRKEILRWTSEI